MHMPLPRNFEHEGTAVSRTVVVAPVLSTVEVGYTAPKPVVAAVSEQE